MSFFNQRDLINKTPQNPPKMSIKPDAPVFATATSPQKRFLKRLESISEAVPGPNAFAQQAASMDRHRLETNAFYQQEMRERAAPALTAHPALRGRSASDPPTPPSASGCTTMSPFVDVGREKGESRTELRLVPLSAEFAEPTARGVIEEERERAVHEVSGGEEERTPVFDSPATFAASASAGVGGRQKKGVKIVEFPPSSLPVKTPKRSILEKLRLNTGFRGSTNTPPTTKGGEEEVKGDGTQGMPVKAKAVLGSPSKRSRVSLGTSSSPSKTNIPRSPSKRKGLFGRKASGVLEPSSTRSKSALSTRSVETEQALRTASTVGKTPPTAFSDPTHYSYGYASQGARMPSQALSEQSTTKHAPPPLPSQKDCSVARSQSLKYFDHAIPPTPPTKDTPPEEKTKRDVEPKQPSDRVPFQQNITTPSKAPPLGIISTSERLSPTKFGNYGRREMPTLVTQPSMYSLHASVVPNMTEAATFEEMKARIDGLGLEGFSLPRENRSSPMRGTVYSPSIYADEWEARGLYATPPPPAVPPLQMKMHGKTDSDESKSSSGHGNIPIFYPGLAKDPSFSDGNARHSERARSLVREHLDVTVPWHGRTHSRDHSSDSRHSKDSSIFAHHVDEDVEKKNKEAVEQSPASFSNPSATPSPLHFLPATTYQPPTQQRTQGKHGNALLTPSRVITPRDFRRHVVANYLRNSPSPSLRPSNGLLESAPSLPAHTASSLLSGSTAQSATPTRTIQTYLPKPLNAVNLDPVKPPTPSPTTTTAPSAPPPAESSTLDAMIEMLQVLKSRNTEISSIRDEMRASNARLTERLTAVESSRGRDTPTPSSAGSSGWSVAGNTARGGGDGEEAGVGAGRRVDTATAIEFYRAGYTGQGDGGREEEVRGDTIAQLRETNTRLLEMVSGFGEKIREMEGRLGGGDGV